MPKHVKYNVEDHRLIFDDVVCEDVTTITLPTIEHNTTTIEKVSGMLGDVDIPDLRVKAMSIEIDHNDGLNCSLMRAPGLHNIECRLARQNFGVAAGEIEHESVKYRFSAMHVSTDGGSVEIGNPITKKEKFSVFRYEEEVAGEVVTLIDIKAGVYRVNGVDYSGDINVILD